ncbi:hypothetical protein CPC08DRAFT_701894 [Agrocybe pediades]|nr:hypothetical protein CPC08DRAFT_701894 [Agrocybe pediades]
MKREDWNSDNLEAEMEHHDAVGIGYSEPNARSRLPSIFLAQQQPGFDNQAYLNVPNSPYAHVRRLSKISEKTEKTEPSMLWQPQQHYDLPDTPRSMASSISTSYGQETYGTHGEGYARYDDPNITRTSPSASAIQRLSTFEKAPSNASTITPDDHLPPTSSESLQNLRTIPDLDSKSSIHLADRDDESVGVPPTPPAKSQSKLSRLASSRASTISTNTRSESSRSSGTSITGSIKTYPALRPSAQSERPPSSAASSVSSKELPPIPSRVASSYHPSYQSSTSSIVRKAIKTALKFEGGEDVDGSVAGQSESQRPQSEARSEQSDRAKTPTPAHPHPSLNASDPKPSPTGRPLSKLAALAQQKASSANKSTGSISFDIPSASQASAPSRPLSKLALLAQQKVDASRMPKLPKTTTEYLSPIANGSSVTTAITTSYQSLYSLTDPSRPNVIPKLDVVPLQALSPEAATSPSDKKPSKLALKIKKANEKIQSPGFPSEVEIPSSISPIFQPKTSHARASPSAFASVLISDNMNSSKDTKGDKEGKRKKKEKKEKKEKPTKKSSKQGTEKGSSPPFTFDQPSPDDIVLNARKKPTVSSKVATPTSPATVSSRV